MSGREPATEEEVYEHIEHIPPKLSKCGSGNHEWDLVDWEGYTAAGRRLKPGEDPNKAKTFDVTEVCKRPNNRGCGMRRHYVATVCGGSLVPQSQYTYSDRNPDLVSPYGVSTTGINVRQVVRGKSTLNKILGGSRIQLAPQGDTRKALKARGAA